MSSPSDTVGPKKAEGEWVEPQGLRKSARSLPELKQLAAERLAPQDSTDADAVDTTQTKQRALAMEADRNEDVHKWQRVRLPAMSEGQSISSARTPRARYTAPKRPSSHTILDGVAADNENQRTTTHHQKGTNGGMPNKANWSHHHHNPRHKLTRHSSSQIWPDPRKYQATSLYFFTLKNPLRRLVIASIESKWWDRTVLTW